MQFECKPLKVKILSQLQLYELEITRQYTISYAYVVPFEDILRYIQYGNFTNFASVVVILKSKPNRTNFSEFELEQLRIALHANKTLEYRPKLIIMSRQADLDPNIVKSYFSTLALPEIESIKIMEARNDNKTVWLQNDFDVIFSSLARQFNYLESKRGAKFEKWILNMQTESDISAEAAQLKICQNLGDIVKYLNKLNTLNNLTVLIVYSTTHCLSVLVYSLVWVLKSDEYERAPTQLILDKFIEDQSYRNYHGSTFLNLSDRFSYVRFTSTSQACYLLNINPAIGIVINNSKYFQNDMKERLGAHFDVYRTRIFMQNNRMPLIISEDNSSEEVHRLFDTLQKCDLSLFRTIVIFIMSHGENGDIIHTRDGNFHIRDDIIAPLLANETLNSTANIIVFVNACRGKYDPCWAKLDELEPNIKTETKDQHPRVAIFYSAKQGCISERKVLKGSTFVQSLCDYFEHATQNIDMNIMAKEIEQYIEKNTSYSSRFEYGTTEFCIKPGTDSNHQLKFEYDCENRLKKTLEDIKERVERIQK